MDGAVLPAGHRARAFGGVLPDGGRVGHVPERGGTVHDAARPEVSLLEETREGETRTLRLRVSSPRRAPLVSIYTESDGELLQAKVNGREVPTAHQQQKPWGVRYHALPEEGAELSLRVRSAEPLVLRVSDLSRELPGEIPFRPRPPQTSASPQESSETTVVSKSFKF